MTHEDHHLPGFTISDARDVALRVAVPESVDLALELVWHETDWLAQAELDHEERTNNIYLNRRVLVDFIYQSAPDGQNETFGRHMERLWAIHPNRILSEADSGCLVATGIVLALHEDVRLPAYVEHVARLNSYVHAELLTKIEAFSDIPKQTFMELANRAADSEDMELMVNLGVRCAIDKTVADRMLEVSQRQTTWNNQLLMGLGLAHWYPVEARELLDTVSKTGDMHTVCAKILEHEDIVTPEGKQVLSAFLHSVREQVLSAEVVERSKVSHGLLIESYLNALAGVHANPADLFTVVHRLADDADLRHDPFVLKGLGSLGRYVDQLHLRLQINDILRSSGHTHDHIEQRYDILYDIFDEADEAITQLMHDLNTILAREMVANRLQLECRRISLALRGVTPSAALPVETAQLIESVVTDYGVWVLDHPFIKRETVRNPALVKDLLCIGWKRYTESDEISEQERSQDQTALIRFTAAAIADSSLRRDDSYVTALETTLCAGSSREAMWGRLQLALASLHADGISDPRAAYQLIQSIIDNPASIRDDGRPIHLYVQMAFRNYLLRG